VHPTRKPSRETGGRPAVSLAGGLRGASYWRLHIKPPCAARRQRE